MSYLSSLVALAKNLVTFNITIWQPQLKYLTILISGKKSEEEFKAVESLASLLINQGEVLFS